MKKILKFIFIFICVFYSKKVLANPYPKTCSYGVNCTWYAWKMAKEKANVSLPNWGNAKDWYKNAQKSGYKVGSDAKANSIVVWGTWTSYGHVGYVESVKNDKIYVWDSTGPCNDESDPEFIACIENAYDEQSDRLCYQNSKDIACEYSLSEYEITGFIYLDEVPITTTKKPTTTTTSLTTTTKKITTTKKEESNDNYLTNINISNAHIEFNKDILEYNIEVDENIDNITVDASLSDEISTINGIGEYQLNYGLNEIKLTVTSTNQETREYIIKVTRKEEQKKETIDNKKDITTNNNILIIISVILVIIIFVIIIIIKKSKLRRK